MTPDTPTLFLVGTALCAAMAVLLAIVSVRPGSAALRLWAASTLAIGLAFALLATRFVLPLRAAGLAGDVLTVLGAALSASGVEAFAGRPARLAGALAWSALALTALVLSLAAGDNFGVRLVIIALGIAGPAVQAALTLLRLPSRRSRATRYLCSAIVLAFSAVYLARALALALGLLTLASALDGMNGGLTRLLGIVAFVVWNIGLLFLVLDREASLDPLTGLLNRRMTLSCGQRMTRQYVAANRPLSVLMIDLDHFKEVNDRFGHPAGDAVLRHFAAQAQQAVRAEDLVGRLGGDEFCIVLPDTDTAQALVIAERLRRQCEETLKQGLRQPLPVTISIGVAPLSPAHATSFAHLVKAADMALYATKERGRNRVVSAAPEC